MSRNPDEIETKSISMLCLGSHHFDPKRKELRSADGALIPLRPQAAEVLHVLGQNAGEIVTKAALIEAVWTNTFVTDDSLVQCIADIRRALRADRSVVETFPKRGYRLNAGSRNSDAGSNESSFPAIAVLPFTNLTGDPEHEYLAESLTEDIITSLSSWRTFPVVAKSSVLGSKGESADASGIAKSLNARYLLEGSVRTEMDRLRLSTHLVDASSGLQLWSGRFEGRLKDPFSLQDEVTQRVVATLKPELRKHEQKRAVRETLNADAWTYYHRGWAFLNQETRRGNAKAREMFEKAIKIDPSYASAVCGISIAHHRDIIQGHARSRQESIARSLEAARQAVALDDTASRLQMNLAGALRLAGYYSEAISRLEKAITLDPSNVSATALLGHSHVMSGQTKVGLAILKDVAKLGPEDQWFLSLLSRALLSAHEYDEAEKTARRGISDRPERPGTYVFLAIALACQGREAEAAAVLEECERIAPGFVDQWHPGFKLDADNKHFERWLRRAKRHSST